MEGALRRRVQLPPDDAGPEGEAPGQEKGEARYRDLSWKLEGSPLMTVANWEAEWPPSALGELRLLNPLRLAYSWDLEIPPSRPQRFPLPT